MGKYSRLGIDKDVIDFCVLGLPFYSQKGSGVSKFLVPAFEAGGGLFRHTAMIHRKQTSS